MIATRILTIPGLAQRPIMGGACCAVSSAWVVEDALSQLPGVQAVHVDEELGLVSVTFNPAEASLARIEQELEGLGFGVASPA